MNARLAIFAMAVMTTPWSMAQNVIQEPQEDPVQAAISEFNRRDAKEPNEVSVVLPPAAPLEEKPGTAPEEASKAPVLVTGKAPKGIQLIDDSEDAEPIAAIPEDPAPQPRKGLEVHVEKIQSGTGNIDPSQVKLLAPFPAKPLSQPPAGWHLEASEDAPPFTREVELSPGKKITLTVRPHLLVPDTNGVDAFTVSEPGYDPSLGYSQNATVGAVLSQSIRQLDDDSKQLGNVIDNLQQLLVSLPKPEPEPIPESAAKNTRKR